MERIAGKAAIDIQPVIQPKDILRARSTVNDIYVDQKVKDYIVDVVMATRNPQDYKLDLKKYIMYGVSPRGTIYLNMAARAYAFINSRGFVIPEDIKAVSLDVLRHRVIVTYEAEAEGLTSEDIIRKVFDQIPVP
jgi:MoxR-like ATPase